MSRWYDQWKYKNMCINLRKANIGRRLRYQQPRGVKNYEQMIWSYGGCADMVWQIIFTMLEPDTYNQQHIMAAGRNRKIICQVGEDTMCIRATIDCRRASSSEDKVLQGGTYCTAMIYWPLSLKAPFLSFMIYITTPFLVTCCNLPDLRKFI